jgi:hypothetical protein
MEDSSRDAAAGDQGAGDVSGATLSDPSTAPPTPPTRCERACRHIASLTAPSSDEKAQSAWMPGCVQRCQEHASDGQLDCYDRARTATELDLCMVH